MNEHDSYNVWKNTWEAFSQGVTSACGELGMQKMALRERTAAGCGGGGGIARWQCVFLLTLAVFEVCQVDEYILTRAAAQGMTLF